MSSGHYSNLFGFGQMVPAWTEPKSERQACATSQSRTFGSSCCCQTLPDALSPVVLGVSPTRVANVPGTFASFSVQIVRL